MPAQMLNPEVLNQLGEEFAERCRRGENPTISEYSTRFTDDEARAVEEFLDSIVTLEKRKTQHPGKPSSDTPPRDFGRYRIEKTLGEGGMGAVYLAHDTQLDRKVALKTPKFTRDSDQNLMKRFYREARSAATLQHPNICPVYDVGELDGIHYISMAYVEGRPLSDFVLSKKLPPVSSVLKVIRKVALALHEAHSQGLIHRDLKPANIMIDRRNEPIVMDFGLARQFGSGETDSVEFRSGDPLAALSQAKQIEARLTMAGTIMGSPGYMASEQLRGDDAMIGPASDVYALGVVMYELLTGQLPFPGDGSLMSIVNAAMTAPPPDASIIRPGVNPKVAAMCCQAMAKHPQDRFESMHAFAVALTELIRADITEGNKHAVTSVTDHAASPELVRIREQYELAKSLYQEGQFPAAAAIMEKMLEGADSQKPANQYTKWAAAKLEKARAKAKADSAPDLTDDFWGQDFETEAVSLPPRSGRKRRRGRVKRRGVTTFAIGAGGAAALLVVVVLVRNLTSADDNTSSVATTAADPVSSQAPEATTPESSATADVAAANDETTPRSTGPGRSRRPFRRPQRNDNRPSVAARTSAAERLRELDTNEDNRLSRQELTAARGAQGAFVRRVIDRFDTFDLSPQDGLLDTEEIQTMLDTMLRNNPDLPPGRRNGRFTSGQSRRGNNAQE